MTTRTTVVPDAVTDVGTETVVTRSGFQAQWGAVFAGALCGAGLAFVLDAFGAAIGLAVSSTAPTWRDASIGLTFLSGIYLILAAVISYGFGAFIAARLRPGVAVAADQVEMIDGYNGLIVWALMTVATALLIVITAQAITRAAAPSNSTAGAAQSVAGENILAFDLDRLFRGARNTPGEYQRAEAARILLTTSSHRGMQQDDRAYLVRLVEAVTGLAPGDAQARVNDISGRAKQNIDRARNNSVILAFMTAAAALAGAVAAWFTSTAGGRQRDGAIDLWRSDWQWPWSSTTRAT
jgi:hypothetical protein